ncbi:g11760 [Coccomyxa elongata]
MGSLDDLKEVWLGEEELNPETRWIYIFICIGLVLLAGLMSGLTLGLMSMDSIDLEVLIRSGTPTEQKHAQRIAPVLSRPHLLLVTLLLVNAAAMEALPIFLDRLLSPVSAIILSVTAVLFFGEIIPQALCTRYGLAIGAYSAWFVRILIWVVGIISFPISKVLDWLLGSEHGALFRRGQLKALVDIHSEVDGLGGGYLSAEEINIIRGALDMTEKKAVIGMTPLDKVFMLPSDAELNVATMRAVLGSGHSRIPVHRPGTRRDILGLIIVKELALLDLEAGTRVGDVKMRSLPMLRADTAMYDLLTLFQTGRSHMVVLTAPPEPPQAVEGVQTDATEEPPVVVGTPPRNLSQSIQQIKGSQTPPRRATEDDVTMLRPAPDKTPVEIGNETSVPVDSRTPASGAESGERAGGTQPGAPLLGQAVAPEEPVGIITIEDVLEELLQQEIVDETDQFVDNMRMQKVNAAVLLKALPPHLRNLMVTRNSGAATATSASAAAARAAFNRQVQTNNLQGLHSVRSADLDNMMPGAQVTQLRRSRTTGKPMPAVQQPLLSQENGTTETTDDLPV